CPPRSYIVITRANIFLDAKPLEESARYPIMMACYLENECQFQFTERVYEYLNEKLERRSELVVNYLCRENGELSGRKRVNRFAKTNNCPNESFVQKHVIYFNDQKNPPKNHRSLAVKREWEMIAMEACALMRLFRTTTDPNRHTVFLIYEDQNLRDDFEEIKIRGKPDQCKLTRNARFRTIMYKCDRNSDKWTCTFQSLGQNEAIHQKNSGHLL
ncbi:hypothetical protein KR026_010460, partial [Drosophila bipectinata]